MLLNDPLNGLLYVFKIESNSLPKEKFQLRTDGKNVFILRIKCNDNSFEDIYSGVQFKQWLVKEIKY